MKKRLIQSVQENRVSHAQLFLGPEGSGTLPLTIAYARYLNCTDRGSEDSCGRCSSCLKFSKLAHPDLHFVFPVNTTKSVSKNPVSKLFLGSWREALAENPYQNLFQWLEFIGIENKQGNISTHESAEIIRLLSYKAFEAPYKVMIIWMVERMNLSASNKLLKILEEPPDQTVFLLVAQNPEQIISTILSRTQMVKVNRIQPTALKAALQEEFSLDEGRAASLTHLSGGNYLEALRHLRESEDSAFNKEQFTQWMRWCYGADMMSILAWVDEMSRIGRERQKNFLQYGIHMMRECLILNFGDSSLVRMEGEEYNFAKKFSPFVNGLNGVDLTEAFDECARYIERNGNPKILLLDLSLRVMKLLRRK